MFSDFSPDVYTTLKPSTCAVQGTDPINENNGDDFSVQHVNGVEK